MRPHYWYIFPTATPAPVGIRKWESVTIGPTQSLGHFDWYGYPALQAAFEATSGVQALGNLDASRTKYHGHGFSRDDCRGCSDA
jgi:hypothetical protein